ncbi:hypothetical protein NYZ99_04930 [Maribacter litopenaei]|uniref:DUF2541 domain-containing protein n=1 Tax=Maribacter litopenaei TaxID=2976127 RepID=A0ABY5YBF6_9FLAO|nr:hypothetical protein [Maribacter litopenaei]UWX55770.1 hypothetical protein NYZ99_04930 [Maribacter litopenaei]
MKKSILLAPVLIVAFGLRSFAQSEEKGWIKLSEKTVSYMAETDKVNMLGKKQNISTIKLKCIRGTVKLKKLRVKMSDGTEKEFSPKGTGVFTNGMSSFAFKLPGNDTKLKELEIDYDSAGNIIFTKRAKVEIWAKLRE